MKEKEYEYLKIPYIVVEDKTICTSSKLLYGKLLLLSHKHGYVHASNDYLASIVNLKARSITRLLTELEKQDYILITGRNNFHRRIYLNAKND